MAADAADKEEEKTSDWKEYEDPKTGQKYYHNAVTGETVWEKPEELMTLEEKLAKAQAEAQNALAEAQGSDTDASGSDGDDEVKESYDPDEDWRKWSTHTDEGSGRNYFVNADTSLTTWTCPKCMMLPGWDGAADDEGRIYYYNEDGATQWSPPYRKECDPALQAGKPWSQIEKDVFATEMSHLLKCDAQALRRDLFDITKSGLALCRLVNLIVPDTVDERALNGVTNETYDIGGDEKSADKGDEAVSDGGESKGNSLEGTYGRRRSLLLRSIDGKSAQPYKVSRRKSMAQFDPSASHDHASNKTILLVDDVSLEQAKENHQLLLNSLSSIGVSVPSYVTPEHLAGADPHETLEVIFRILQKHAQRTCSLSKTRELLVLCDDAGNKDDVGLLRSLTGGEVL